MSTARHVKLLILGSGAAGCTAAIYAARANLKPLLITGLERGGQLTTTTDVDNWPGDVHGVQGPELMQRMLEHTQRFDTEVVDDHIHTAELRERPFRLCGDAGVYTCDALIIATGASAKYLGLPSEQALLGKGVSSCATCDGYFFKNQAVAVIGGGSTAVEEALYLSALAARVTLVHRYATLGAEAVLVDHLLAKAAAANSNIDLVWNHELIEVLGDPEHGVSGIRIRHTDHGHIDHLALQGVFIAIGHAPNTGLFAGQLDTRDDYLCTKGGNNGDATMTSRAGVFAAGDVIDSVYRQAITSAGSGCMAALDADRYLKTLAV